MTGTDEELEGRTQRLLAEDADIAELGIDAVREGAELVIRGQVNSVARRELIVTRVRELLVDAAPGIAVRSEIIVTDAAAPEGPAS